MTDDLKKPMFSVVIPLYNKANQVRKTLHSVLNQTFTDYEIVIVDDGSTDGSQDVVKNWIGEKKSQDILLPTIRLVTQQNAGVSAARNHGIAESEGKYIALLDADDEWKPEYLTTQADLIKRYPQCEVFATNYEFRNEKGEISHTIFSKLKFEEEDGILENYFEVASYSHPPLWTSAVVVSKEAFEIIGGFPLGCTSGEDLLTWAKLACLTKIAFTKKINAVYFTPTTGPTGVIPKDLKTTKDYVGTTLHSLYKQYPSKELKKYISFWYKMRAVINLGLGYRLPTLKCAFKSLNYNFGMMKSWALIFLALSPKFIIDKALKK